jgi:hypothetical protein
MMAETRKMPIRLALREEGPMWNAYLARQGTLEGSRLIGSIAIGAVTKNPEIKERFQTLMTDVMKHAIQQTLGVTPDEFIVERGPESERSGHG